MFEYSPTFGTIKVNSDYIGSIILIKYNWVFQSWINESWHDGEHITISMPTREGLLELLKDIYRD